MRIRSEMYGYHDHDIITNIDHVKDLMYEIKQQGPITPLIIDPSSSSSPLSSPIEIIAKKARLSLNELAKKNKYECGNDDLFKPYDTHKKRVITYDDFKSSLIKANANISTNDTYNLATVLDKDDTGILQYDNILNALKTIEDNGSSIQSLSQDTPLTSSSSPSSIHQKILSNEAREILNQLREPYIYDDTTKIPYQVLLPNKTCYEIDNNENLYPHEYESYIKTVNHIDREVVSQPRRHIKQIQGFQHDMYRPAPYHRDDLDYDAFPHKPKRDSSHKFYRSRSAPPPNQIKSLAFDETPIKKKVSSPSKTSSPMSLYEHLMLAKNKTIGDYVTLDKSNNDDDNIVTSPIVKDTPSLSSTASSRKKTVVNSLITQLKGKLMPLRIQLKKFDASHSGVVNMNEFVAALSSTGIVAPKKQLIELFKESSQYTNDTSKGHYAVYEDQRAVNIDDFISSMQEKAYNSHSHLVNEQDRNDNIKREDSRIFKKVLHATEKVGGDIHRYFLCQDADYHGWIQPKKLKEAFKHMGANINDDEFSKVVNKLDMNDNGLVSVHQLDITLNKYVNDYDSSHYEHIMSERNAHGRYSNTYKPQHYHNVNKSVNEFDEIRRSKLVRKERMQWAKLRNKLVTSNDVLNKVFSSSPDKQLDFLDRRIDVNDIQRNLARAGIQLGNDDTNRFKAYLQEFKRNKAKENKTIDNYVSAKELCEFLDPRVSYHKDLQSIHPDKIEDGGLFSSHLRNPPYDNKSFDSSSIYSSDKVLEKSFGQKKKIKQSSNIHISEPSSYWLLEHEKIIDPEFKYGQSYIPRFLLCSNDLNKKEINGNSKLTSSMLKQPYDQLLSRKVEHQYGRRNSSQKNSMNKESVEQEVSPYKSSRKLRLPLNSNDINDSMSSYHSSDSSKYDIQRWATKSLTDFMAAKRVLGLDIDDNTQKTTKVRFEEPNNIYTSSIPVVKSMKGGGRKK